MSSKDLGDILFLVKQKRLERDFAAARALADEAVERVVNEPTSATDASSVFYERGYLNFITPDWPSALKDLSKSAEISATNGDPVREIFPRQTVTWIRFLDGQIDGAEALDEYQGFYDRLSGLSEAQKSDRLTKNASFMLLRRLTEFSFEENRTDFESWVERYLEDDIFHRRSGQQNYAIEVAKLQGRALRRLAKNQFLEACETFNQFIDAEIDLSQIFEQPIQPDYDNMREYFGRYLEFNERDYLHFGNAVLQLTRPESHHWATEIWRKGLVRSEAGHDTVYSHRLRASLKSIDREA